MIPLTQGGGRFTILGMIRYSTFRHARGRLAAALLMAVITANWAWQGWRDYHLDIGEFEVLGQSLARAADYQIDGSMRSMDTLLSEVANRVHPARWPDPKLEAWFQARLVAFPELRNINIIDASGHMVGRPITAPDRTMPTRSVDLSDREYFKRVRDAFPSQALVIGRPVQSRVSGLSSIPLARAIVGPDGGLAGMVVAGVDPEIFRQKLESVVFEEAGGAALLGQDGVFLARVPRHEETLGRTFPNPLFDGELGKLRAGVAHFVSPADGNDKITAFRRLERYPLMVTVGITKATALARWRRQSYVEGGILAALALALAVLAVQYDRRSLANTRLTGQLAASRDELEAQVEERTAHLAASNAELEQFAYVASHDLQEPLRTITSFLQLLQRRYGGQLDSQADEYIAFAVSGARRMSLLINDVLAFSRIGRQSGDAESCDTAALARAAVTALETAIAESGATVTMGELPPVRCVPAQLQSLFQNLIGNGIKYRDPHRPPVVVVSARVLDDALVEIAVADNGIGIEPQYHERIFGIFQRLHTSDSYPGTGIGLALCRKIVDRHGGRIGVESAPGRGTIIRFTLPAG